VDFVSGIGSPQVGLAKAETKRQKRYSQAFSQASEDGKDKKPA